MFLRTGDYKLSISYIHLFRSSYQYPIFHLTHQYLQTLLEQKNKAESLGNSVFSFIIYFCLLKVIIKFTEDDWDGMKVSCSIAEGGNVATILTLFALGLGKLKYRIPEHIIVFDPRLKVNALINYSLLFS